MDVQDTSSRETFWFRLHEKGGRRHEVVAHHNAEELMDLTWIVLGFAVTEKA